MPQAVRAGRAIRLHDARDGFLATAYEYHCERRHDTINELTTYDIMIGDG